MTVIKQMKIPLEIILTFFSYDEVGPYMETCENFVSWLIHTVLNFTLFGLDDFSSLTSPDVTLCNMFTIILP